jgi:hypothetical protein
LSELQSDIRLKIFQLGGFITFLADMARYWRPEMRKGFLGGAASWVDPSRDRPLADVAMTFDVEIDRWSLEAGGRYLLSGHNVKVFCASLDVSPWLM